MAFTQDEIERWVEVLDAARRERRCCAPISSISSIDIDDAYRIQRGVTARRLQRGESVVGWKLGYTSLAMRTQMGIDQPNFGPLTDAMLIPSGAAASAALIQPRVEPEIGLRFDRPLGGHVTVTEVLAAVGEAFACLEIVDSVYPDYQFRLEDNTADGSSAAQVVIGPALAGSDRLDEVRVTLMHNGNQVASSTGAAASGNPAAGVVWLVQQLAQREQRIEAGDIVITGGLTKAVPLAPGDHIEAVFDDDTCVEVSRLRTSANPVS